MCSKLSVVTNVTGILVFLGKRSDLFSDPTHHKLVEEKEFAQSQIDFLNSVIVDLQRKNEALKARIEVLEIGITPADADELNL
jgi:hypothetical protein